VNDVHFRGSILVSAVFDAYFSIYVQRTFDLFRIYRAAGGDPDADELPGRLARLVAQAASEPRRNSSGFCARAVDYCPPVDLTFGDYLRALITVVADLMPVTMRDSVMLSCKPFRVRGIFPEGASYFSKDALCWPHLPKWSDPPKVPDPDALPTVTGLVFCRSEWGDARTEQYSTARYCVSTRMPTRQNWALMMIRSCRSTPSPYAPSFHTVFRTGADGKLRIDMVVELVQTKEVPFDPELPQLRRLSIESGGDPHHLGPQGQVWRCRQASCAVRDQEAADRGNRPAA